MFLPIHDDNPVRRFPIVTVAIIVVNVVCQGWLSSLDDHQQRMVVAQYGFVPARLGQLLDRDDQPVVLDLRTDLEPIQGIEAKPEEALRTIDDMGNPRVIVLEPSVGPILLSLLTCMFLHVGWLHLAGNMWFFWIFGNNIEDRLGRIVFLLFYLIGGVVASLSHWLMQTQGLVPVVGASGAVAVTLGAYAVTYPSAHVRLLVLIFIIRVPALVVLSLWFLLQLVEAALEFQMGMTGGVALWAHIGGFVFGMALQPILALCIPEPEEDRVADSERPFDAPPTHGGF